MTAKDYELIASTIRNLMIDEPTRQTVAEDFAGALWHTNARFDAERFVRVATK